MLHCSFIITGSKPSIILRVPARETSKWLRNPSPRTRPLDCLFQVGLNIELLRGLVTGVGRFSLFILFVHLCSSLQSEEPLLRSPLYSAALFSRSLIRPTTDSRGRAALEGF